MYMEEIGFESLFKCRNLLHEFPKANLGLERSTSRLAKELIFS